MNVNKLLRDNLCLSVALCMVGAGVLGTSAARGEKIPVESLDDLPPRSYKVEGSVTQLLKTDEQFAKLAQEVRADIVADLDQALAQT